MGICTDLSIGETMEPIRFADILFVSLVLLVTFAILWMVNKSKNKAPKE